MSWFLYVRGLRGPSPQIIHDGHDKPYICEGIRGRVIEGTARRLTPRELRLSFRALMRRYPPPRLDDDPPPLPPAPAAPKPRDGAAAVLAEVA